MDNEVIDKTSLFTKIGEFFNKRPLIVYIIRRIFSAMFTIFLVLTTVFLLLRAQPDSKYLAPYRGVIDKTSDARKQDVIDQILAIYGRDVPPLQQLARYYYNIIPIEKEVCVLYLPDVSYNYSCAIYETVRIDLGSSLKFQDRTVVSIIAAAIPWSARLGFWAMLIELTIGYPLGILMAAYKGKLLDIVGNGYIVLMNAVPGIVYYMMIRMLVITVLHWPSQINPHSDVSQIKAWIPPIIAIALFGVAGSAMWVRRFMVDELNADYVSFARSKGLSENRIMFTHVFRNALVPVARSIPVSLMYIITGSYFVERLWSIPGTGRLLIEHIGYGDDPVVQGLVIFYAVLSASAFLIGDLTTVFADPRISLTKNK